MNSVAILNKIKQINRWTGFNLGHHSIRVILFNTFAKNLTIEVSYYKKYLIINYIINKLNWV